MATQTGSIDLEATNAVKLAAEASVDNKLTNYTTHAQLDLSADNIKSEVAETYATKSEAALELSKSGTVVVLDEAADARLKALTIHGLSQQDGTPSPSAPVEIKSVEGRNLSPYFSQDLSDVYNATTNPDGYWFWFSTEATYTQKDDGWVHVEYSNTGSSAVYPNCIVQQVPALKNGALYTFMVEIANATISGDVKFSPNGSAGSTVAFLNNVVAFSIANNSVYYKTITAKSDFSGCNRFTRSYFNVPAGGSISLDLRISIYEDYYLGAYQPPGTICVNARGRNLWESVPAGTYSGVTLTANGDGSVTINGTASASVNIETMFIVPMTGTYRISGCPSGGGASTYQLWTYDYNTPRDTQITDVGSGGTGTLTAGHRILLRIRVQSGYTCNNVVMRPMLAFGSDAQEFMPYTGSTTPIPVTLRSLPDGTHDEWISGDTEDTLVQRVGVVDLSTLTWAWQSTWQAWYTTVADAEGCEFTSVAANMLCTTLPAESQDHMLSGTFTGNGIAVNYRGNTPRRFIAKDGSTSDKPTGTAFYELATPITTTYPHTDLPYVSDGDSVWVDAQVTPTIDVTYWSENGETVSALSSTLTQTAAGLELQLQGKVDSDEEWVSWMHAGTDPTTHEPYLAMGQDSDYPSVVYGSGEAQFYDGEGDVEHNILARFGSNGAIIGRSDESHITQTATTTRLFGSDGSLVLEAGFQNVSDGHGNKKQGVRVTDSNNASHIDVSPTTDTSGFDGKLDLGVYMKGIGLMSSNGGEVEISSDFAANGLHAAVEARKTVSGTEQIHGFTLGFDPNDNPYVNINNPAAWLAALGLTVQEGAMTFASGLNSSYGSAPVRKYGAMGILKLNSVRLASQLASGGSVVIGTLPTGFVPLGSVDMHINIESNSSNYRNNYITVEYSGSSNPGRVTLYNRSGAAIPNTVTFSCTCPFFV